MCPDCMSGFVCLSGLCISRQRMSRLCLSAYVEYVYTCSDLCDCLHCMSEFGFSSRQCVSWLSVWTVCALSFCLAIDSVCAKRCLCTCSNYPPSPLPQEYPHPHPWGANLQPPPPPAFMGANQQNPMTFRPG